MHTQWRLRLPPFFLLLLFFFFFFRILTSLPSYYSITQPTHPEFSCKQPHDSYQFCNTSLPIPVRARSLISMLTLPEKIKQLSDKASPILRLGIPAYEWWSESLHGIATNGPGVSFNGSIPSATGFPQVIVTAASFNRSLWSSIASAIAVEARAMYNAGQAGLTFWAPSVNIFRDPRWGRGQETPGEDPLVVAAYAVDYVKGLQGELVNGDDDDGLMISACCKHFTAYDLEKWGSFDRYSFDAVVSDQDMKDTYQPPFKSCIQEGKASCLMCSYNRVNGVPACARQDLLEEVRTAWGFNGYITSDCDAVATILEYQKYVRTPEDAVAVALKSGMDINCGTYLLRHTASAVKKGKVQEDDIDRALLNLFKVQMRLGLFDGDPAEGKFGKLGPGDVCAPEHRKLALEAARQGIVLLKNENKFLPLNKKKVASLAVIGPLANTAIKLGGGYSGLPCNPKSLFEGFESYVKKTSFAAGCFDVSCNTSEGFKEAIDIAKEASVVVVVAGLDLSQETEDRDRVSLLLPGKQMDLISAIALASKSPLVLVLTGGGPIDVSFANGDSQIASIIWVGYPGEAGGQALAEVIFGDFNPGGRLPLTWYPESFTRVPMNDMSMRADPLCNYPGRTYRFYSGDTVYKFGHGLSYSKYTYKFLSIPHKLSLSPGSLVTTSSDQSMMNQGRHELVYINVDEVSSCHSLRFQAQICVTNNGDMDGSHVVMLFSKAPKVSKGMPEKQLIGFTRVHTVSHGSSIISILVEPCEHLSIVNEWGEKVLPLGNHTITLEGLEHSIFIEIEQGQVDS